MCRRLFAEPRQWRPKSMDESRVGECRIESVLSLTGVTRSSGPRARNRRPDRELIADLILLWPLARWLMGAAALPSHPPLMNRRADVRRPACDPFGPSGS